MFIAVSWFAETIGCMDWYQSIFTSGREIKSSVSVFQLRSTGIQMFPYRVPCVKDKVLLVVNLHIAHSPRYSRPTDSYNSIIKNLYVAPVLGLTSGCKDKKSTFWNHKKFISTESKLGISSKGKFLIRTLWLPSLIPVNSVVLYHLNHRWNMSLHHWLWGSKRI